MAQLRRRVKTLESQQKASDIDAQIDRLSSYGLRHATDFDKYSALSMAESLASDAKQHNHPKASFLAVASQTLRGHLQKPTKLFQAYFLALFADKEYSQILDRISMVDKSFRADTTQSVANFQDMPCPSGRGSNRLRRIVCFYCGLPGHTAPRCFRRLQPGSRFSPYSRPARGRSVNQ